MTNCDSYSMSAVITVDSKNETKIRENKQEGETPLVGF